MREANNAAGTIWYAATQMNPTPSANGSGALARFTLHPLTYGSSVNDAVTGAERWTYPTELPLGHSPTVADGIVYVGGFDHKLHALDAMTGVAAAAAAASRRALPVPWWLSLGAQ